jgi:uncharacterized repeat protein (TIGR01451 family)
LKRLALISIASLLVLSGLIILLSASAFSRPLISTTVLMSEVKTAGAADVVQEFIELYNASIAPLSLNGYAVVYRSAAGTGNNLVYTFLATQTIPAHGNFLLVRSGKNVGTPSDATFTQALGAAGGGLAISTTGTIVDSVGWGTATNAFVETAVAPAPPAAHSTERLPGGAFGNGQDTDSNADDLHILTMSTPQHAAIAARIAIGFSISKSAPAGVSVSQTFTYTLIATNRISDTAVSVIMTDAVPLSATIASVSNNGVVLGNNVVSWTIDSVLNGESITRTIVVTAPAVGLTLINSDYGVWAGNYLTRTTGNAVTTNVTGSGSGCSGAFTPIYTVQGAGLSSPLVGQSVTIEGVVVGDFQAGTQQSGFYLQDPLGDGNPATSDGVFVYAPGSLNVAIGDVVRVTGTVAEFNDLTELSPVTNVQLCSSGQPLAPIVLDLPVAATNDQERYEGMYVTIPETLTVDQNFFQGRYGQVTLSADGRMYNPTNGNGFGDTVELNARRMLVLDDGSTAQNPDPVPYIGVDNTLRAGDVITNLTGVIDYGAINSNSAIRHYRLQPIGPVTVTRVNTRSAAPDPVGGSIRVASFNVLNYFNGNGAGSGFPTSRGADTLAEFVRQRDKIIPAILALDADVVGLMEIENDNGDATTVKALQDLVNGLNAVAGAGTYAFVSEPAPGSDAIKVAMIYQTARVTPQGATLNHQVTTNPDYNPLFDRPPLAQRFRTSDGQEFFVIVNHFKSKGSCPASATDVDADYGQGCWNVKRTAQASNLLTFIAQLQLTDPDVFVIGDLNAYGAEDPINTLIAGGLVNQALRVPAADRYSYIFDGQSGYLDHALSTLTLNPQITGVTYWHINADEPSVIDYNTEFKPQDLYTATPYRASDHDPVLIGFNPMPISQADFSDSISTYGVAWHRAPHAIRLGSTVTDDNGFALNADNASDDGVTRVNGRWQPDQTVTLNAEISGGSGWLTGWFDWNLDGDFDDANEKAINQAVISGVNTINVIVPNGALVGSGVATALAARFRLYESPIEPLHPAAPNVAMTNGGAIGGEVEDYAWSFTPTAIELHSLAARSASLPPWLLPLGLSVLLAGWCLRRRR